MHGEIGRSLYITEDTGIQSTYSYTFLNFLPLIFNTSYAEDDGTPTAAYWTNSADFYNADVHEAEVALALTRIADISGVAFNYSSSSADIRIIGLDVALVTVGGSDHVGGLSYYPSVADSNFRSDLYLTSTANMNSNGFTVQYVVSHELNHTIGLLDVEGTDLENTSEDSHRFSVMSYKVHSGTGLQATELQLYDIAGLQSLYGRTAHNGGATTYSNFVEGTAPRMFSIWDSGGDDTIDASSQTSAALIDLRPGYFSSIGPSSGVVATVNGRVPDIVNEGYLNVSVAFGAYIENASGTDYNDVIVGNLLTNVINGGAGDDIIFGDGTSSNHDQGEADYEQVTNVDDYAEAPPAEIADYVDDNALQADLIYGEDGDDYLHGGGGNDALVGGSGSDTFVGGGGSDTIWGGDENSDIPGDDDEVDYSTGSSPITITYDDNTRTASVQEGTSSTDTLHSIETIIGTAGGDDIQAGEGIETLDGGAGDDLLRISGSSTKIRFGAGDGNDVVQTGEGDYQLVLEGIGAEDIELIASGTDITKYYDHSTAWTYLLASLNILTIKIKSTGEVISFVKQSNVDSLFSGAEARDGVVLAGHVSESYELEHQSVTNSPLDSIRFADNSVWSAEDIWSKIAEYQSNSFVSFNLFKPIGPPNTYKAGELPAISQFSSPMSYVDYLNSTYFEQAPLDYPAGQNFTGSWETASLQDGYGNDTLTGGVGYNWYRLSFGDDTVIWNIGDGDDWIESTGGRYGNDILVLGAGIAPADLQFAATGDGSGLIISFANVEGSITLASEIGALAGRGAFSIVFDDETVWTHEDILTAASGVIVNAHQYVLGTEYDDWLISNNYQTLKANFTVEGGQGNDVVEVSGDGGGTIVFSEGDGHDRLLTSPATAYRGDARSDILSLTDILPNEATFKRGDSALIITVTATGDTFVVQNQFDSWDQANGGVDQIVFGDSTIWTRSDILDAIIEDEADELVGGANSDWLFGGNGNDELTGGAGDDMLDGGGGDDLYHFEPGDGQDRIREDSGAGAGGNDTLEFGAGIDPGDVMVSQMNDGSGLVLQIAGTSNSVTIERAISASGARIETVVFADETVWEFADLMALATTPTTGNDTFFGSELADTLAGGAGDDWLYGGLGNDTYRFASGDGDDTIYEYGAGGSDTIEFLSDIAPSNVTVSQDLYGEGLVLSFPGGSITIGYCMTQRSARIEQVRFDDETVWSFADLMTRSTLPTSGSDTFYGSEFAETLFGGGGDDVLVGRDGADVLAGGTGDDTLDGAGGGDIYQFAPGDGQDVISEYGLWDYGYVPGEDVIQFAAGIDPEDVIVSQINDGTDLLLQIDGTNDSITIDGGIESDYGTDWWQIEKIVFADETIWTFADLMTRATVGTAGDDTIYGSSGGDTLSGGAGNDTLVGRSGNDTYQFGLGGGQDVVVEYDYDGGGVLEFGAGISVNDVFVWQPNSDGDIVFLIAGTDDSITISQMNPEWIWATNISTVRFADDTTWSFADVIAHATASTEWSDVLYGSYLSETLSGGDGDDTLFGQAGDDTIAGGTGTDTLLGGYGEDSFVFDTLPGAGNVDTIEDFEVGIDRIVLDSTVFAGFPVGALSADAFVLGTAAADASDRIIYDDATGTLWLDTDGSGTGAAVEFAILTSLPSLTASDFLVI